MRLGLLANNRFVSLQLHEVLQTLKQHGVTIVLLENTRDDIIESSPPSLGKRINQFGYRVMSSLEARIVLSPSARERLFSQVDVSSLVDEVVTVTPQPEGRRNSVIYPEEDLTRVRALSLDAILRGGGAILRGGILAAATHGIISLHHGDNRRYRGMPAAFWEVYNVEADTGFIIQQLTEQLDAGRILARGNLFTRRGFLENLLAIYDKSYTRLGQVLLTLATDGTLPAPEPASKKQGKLYRLPNVAQQLTYLLRLVGKRLSSAWQSRRGLAWDWSVFLAPGDWRSPDLSRLTAIPNPPGRFLADPFLWTRDDETWLFVEDLDRSTGRGVISCAEIRDGSVGEFRCVLEESFHLSFPFLFEHRDELYMIPETCDASEIRLYRCRKFPGEWEFVRTLMSDVAAVDTVVVPHGDHWLMMSNQDSARIGDQTAELYVFTSDDPVSGEWQPHPQNPVVFDTRVARNGGVILEDGEIYRVRQGMDFNFYGKRFTVSRVSVTDGSFSEEEVLAMEPGFAPGVLGTHHYSTSGGWCALDGVALRKLS